MSTFYSMVEALLLVTALSMDAFVSSFAYGTNKIKIPLKSVTVVNLVCTFILTISIYLGTFIMPFIHENLTTIVSFVILLVLGLAKLFDSTIKMLIRKYNKINKKLRFSFSNLKFVLNIYADPEKADMDSSRVLSPKEAAYLAIALSIDGLAVGFGAGLTEINHLAIILFSLITHMVAIILGSFLGNKIAEKTSLNLSWLSGVILIILAIIKF